MAAHLVRLDITPLECLSGFFRGVDEPDGGIVTVDMPNGVADKDIIMFEKDSTEWG